MVIMKTIEKTNEYIVIEFDDNDLHEDKDIALMNRCTIRDIPYEFVDEDETILKIWRK